MTYRPSPEMAILFTVPGMVAFQRMGRPGPELRTYIPFPAQAATRIPSSDMDIDETAAPRLLEYPSCVETLYQMTYCPKDAAKDRPFLDRATLVTGALWDIGPQRTFLDEDE